MTLARRAEITIEWQTKDISHDILPYLTGLSYVDNLAGAADDIAINLHDRDGLWSGDWRPTFGDSVVVRAKAEPWITKVRDLRLGKFAHDKATMSVPAPSTVSLKCVSAPLATGLRRRKRTRPWSGVTLKQIASDIATRAGLKLLWDGPEGLKYRHRAQQDKSDLEFLQEECVNVGRTLKVTEDQIAIFDEFTLDKGAPVGTIDIAGGWILPGGSVDSDDSERYGSCHIAFLDPRSGKIRAAQYVDKKNPDGQTLELKMSIESIGHAEALCKARLRAANRFANKGRIVVVGDLGLVAGVVFDLAGARAFDGRYIVTRAEHALVGGYRCTLDIRRVMEDY